MPTTRRRSNLTNIQMKDAKENCDVSELHMQNRSRSTRRLLKQLEPNLRQDEVDVKPIVTSTVRSQKRKRNLSPSPRKPIESESTEQETSDNDTEEEKCSYEQLWQENAKANADFLAQLGIVEAKQKLDELVKKTSKPTQRGLKREKIPVEPLPRRKSLRIQHVGPPKPIYIPEELTTQTDEHPRPPPGPLQMGEVLMNQLKPEVHTEFMPVMKTVAENTNNIKPMSSDLKSFLKDFSRISLTEDGVAKVVKDRVFSLAVHPTTDKILVAAGDKWGKVGFWDVLSSNETDGVVAYCPHSRPVNCLRLPAWDPMKVYSCSYDGTLRCGDFEKGIFDEIYSCPEDEDTLFRNFDFHSEHVMLVSQTDRCVGVVDMRTNQKSAEHLYPCHLKYLRTVSVHPLQKQYFVTASVDTTVCLWDLRKMSEKKNTPIVEHRHGKSVDSAYFSPVTGKYILSASADNTLNIFDSSKLTADLSLKKSIRHDNHVGRWLTKFRASWHPAREDLFVVGSMKRPRQIDIYSDDCKELQTFKSDFLASVCSLNAIHPTRNIIAGGNSSGRIHVFM